MSEYKKSPIIIDHNRVWRIYSGGKLLDEFCGSTEGEDSFFPEDWLASVVEANNLPRENQPEREGLSTVCGSDGEFLKDIIEQNASEILGDDHLNRYGKNMGFLVKLLDSAVRLPIQVHPDKAAAKKLFSSDYGKTEAWYILGGREIGGEKPYILIGFKEGIKADDWESYFEKQDISAMENVLHKVYVKPGDLFLIKGGTPHAIGPGCFLLEIQEPTDYTISVEKKAPDGSVVPDFLCHQGIGFDKMFSCFHYDGDNLENTLKKYKIIPKTELKDENNDIQNLITYEHTPAFSLKLINVKGSYVLRENKRARILVVISGTAKFRHQEMTTHIKRGDIIFLPAEIKNVKIFSDEIQLIECFPPEI